MSKLRRKFLYACAGAVLVLFASAAFADYNCYTTCDPYSSPCDQYCEVCQWYTIDGCGLWESSTCGDSHNACIPDNCSPSWYESSRVTQGTYGNGSMFSCSHHSVQWVGVTDGNHCNINSYYYTYHYCDDVLDGGKSGFYPDCCDGYGPGGVPNSLYTCDHNHSCTG